MVSLMGCLFGVRTRIALQRSGRGGPDNVIDVPQAVRVVHFSNVMVGEFFK